MAIAFSQNVIFYYLARDRVFVMSQPLVLSRVAPLSWEPQIQVPNIVFGCGDDNQGFTFDQHKISGILGLDLGINSLIVQYADRPNSRSFLILFGVQSSRHDRRDIQTISIVRARGAKNYYVKLINVSVGDKRIGFPLGRFNPDPSTGEGGCLFDTGAISMFFDEEACEVVRNEFDDHFSSFGLQRVYGVNKDLKFCYKYHPTIWAYACVTRIK
ncbi:hypothetical protein CDL15_Pgr002508 [Punica granatum]|uniref:Xylanase inhibitor C-terminal domain-containing protein n=1 Tax=Punica granatum TaxID=22663 RepID=A0A218XW54_PUNGR|nr:hypothetical protein CDL15_Pgr002508 [Punica granatum]